MGKFLLTLLITSLLLIGSLFFIPINFFVSSLIKNSDVDIQYSYLEGNIYSGKILDLYYDNNFIGDFNYKNEFTLNDISLYFNSIDERDIEGKVVKELPNITDTGTIVVKDFSASSIVSTDLIEYVNILLNIFLTQGSCFSGVEHIFLLAFQAHERPFHVLLVVH